MNILSVHNYYLIAGGEDKSCRSERLLLKENGHSVIEYNVNNSSVNGIMGWVLNLLNIFFNVKIYKDVKLIIKINAIDIVHVQNFFPLISPSVFYAAFKLKIPVVFTVRNYRLICSNGLFFRDGKVCTKCNKSNFKFNAFRYGCYRNNRTQTLIVSTMTSLHKFLGTWKRIDGTILLTDFSKKIFIENGWDKSKLFVKPNFIIDDITPNLTPSKTITFIGRFSDEKGIIELLDAWKKINSFDYTLKLGGTGPLENDIKKIINDTDNISLLGLLNSEEIYSLLSESLITVFPSNWFEGMPRTIIESLAVGTPVISKNIGAMSTMIIDGYNGYKYSTNDELSSLLQNCIKKEDELILLRKNCINDFEEKYSSRKNYDQLIGLYNQLIQKNNIGK